MFKKRKRKFPQKIEKKSIQKRKNVNVIEN